MKTIILFLVLFAFTSYENKNDLYNCWWKRCGGSGYSPDVLDFRNDFYSVKNDTIYQKDSAIATIDKIEYHFGERRLYIKNFENKTGIYCPK